MRSITSRGLRRGCRATPPGTPSASSSVSTSGGASRIRPRRGVVDDEAGVQGGGGDLGARRRSARSSPISRPSPRTSVTRGSAASPSRSFGPARSRARAGPRASIVAMTASAAAQATGLPPKVVPWLPGSSSSPAAPTPMQAPIGKPPPRPLASVTMSGVRPRVRRGARTSARCGPCPVCTSSSQSRAPCSSAMRARRGEVALGRYDDAGLALDRLEQDGGGLVGHGGRERVGVAVRDERDVAGQRLERRRGRPPWTSARARPWCGRGSRPRRRRRGCGRCAG